MLLLVVDAYSVGRLLLTDVLRAYPEVTRLSSRRLAACSGSIQQRRYRMRWIGTPNLSFFHDLSAVYTGTLRTIPRARQARSPNDKPSGRVLVIRFPAAFACSAVKAVASRTGLSVASHASPGVSPRLTSLPCTSARLTVLLVAVLNISGVSLSAPGSRFSTASRAEASRTILFIPSRLAPFVNQLVDEGCTSATPPLGCGTLPSSPSVASSSRLGLVLSSAITSFRKGIKGFLIPILA